MEVQPIVDDSRDESQKLKQLNEILEKKVAEFVKADSELREQVRKLVAEKNLLSQQMQKISDREIEHRTRAEVSEELIEKFFDKMLERVH